MKPDADPYPSRFLTRLKWLHLLLLGGMLLFTLMAYLLRDGFRNSYPPAQDLFLYLVPLAALGGYFASLFLFGKLLSAVEVAWPLRRKLARFQTACLLQYTCLEAPALLALFAYLKNGFALYLATAASLVIYLYTRKPTRRKIRTALPLNREEMLHFENPRS